MLEVEAIHLYRNGTLLFLAPKGILKKKQKGCVTMACYKCADAEQGNDCDCWTGMADRVRENNRQCEQNSSNERRVVYDEPSKYFKQTSQLS